jgi:O-antigen ligase
MSGHPALFRIAQIPRGEDWGGAVARGIGGYFLAAGALAVFVPAGFWWLLAATAAAAAAVGLLAFRRTVVFCAGWLLIAGATLEMVLGDILGGDADQNIIALVKAAELALGLLCVLRYGPAFDMFNPAFGYLFIFVAGLAHGLHPGLTPIDSLRSLAGSIAPFAFCFARLPRAWARAIIGMTCWIPPLTLIAGAVLALADIRPLFVESGGWRLAALGHPAFLGGFCLAAIEACLLELLRHGRGRTLALLLANGAILIATGARAPVFYAVLVGLGTLLFAHSPAFPWRRRLALLLGITAVLPLAVAAAGALVDLRLFNLLNGEAGNLSGRDLLWPEFERAASASPWFGWGLGAGNVIIPSTSELARTIGSWAAHNEYLRMAAEGGQIGRGLLILLFFLWVFRHTSRLCRSERVVMRLVFVAFACHAYTDNVLISTSACVFFTFVAAVFARGEREGEAAGQEVRRLARDAAGGELPAGRAV